MKALVGGGMNRSMKMTSTIPGNIHAATRRERLSRPGAGEGARFFGARFREVPREREEVVLRVILELLDFQGKRVASGQRLCAHVMSKSMQPAFQVNKGRVNELSV
jgi:hypothetical protein